MLQRPEPDDYVIATGETQSVLKFVELAFDYAGLNYKQYVVIDPDLYRPAEVKLLLGDASKANAKIGWRHETSFEMLVRDMVDADYRAIGVERRKAGALVS
jgi:GDPmannose 4,6-dehydratase